MPDGARRDRRPQDQATAAWIGHLNQLRIDALVDRLADQDLNLADALATIEDALRRIDLEVVATNRGGVKGMHGFIAEVAEVGIGNARARVLGERAVHDWVNDNGPVDLLRDGVAFQQKFVASGGRFGLGAVAEHLNRYPDFVTEGGRYLLPADHYDMIRRLHAMPREAATKLVAGTGGPSLKDWERVHTFFEGNGLGIDALEPSALDYADVQRGAYAETLAVEEEAIHVSDGARRQEAAQAARPSLRQGAAATAAGAVAEGGSAFLIAVVEKCRGGRRVTDLTREDWADIGRRTGVGAGTGALKGATIYAISNLTATHSAVAGAIAGSAIGVAGLAYRLHDGAISEAEFLEDAELLCLESAVGALSAIVGQVAIPVPVLGAVIGSTVGSVVHRVVVQTANQRDAAVIARHLAEQRALEADLDEEQRRIVEQLQRSTEAYLDVLERAFSPDVEAALRGSIALAQSVGVGAEDVLDTPEKTAAYFLD